MDIESALKKVSEDLAVAEAELIAAQTRVNQLTQAQVGLAFARDNYNGSSKKAHTAAASVVVDNGTHFVLDERMQWQVLGKQEQVLRALRELGRPAETREVADRLFSVGLDGDRTRVKSALNSLKYRDKVVSVRPGLWSLPQNAETPAVTGVSGGNNPSDEEGVDSLEETASTAPQAERQFHAQLGTSIGEVTR